MRFVLPALILALAGCSMMQPPTEIVRTPSSDWQAAVTDRDRLRLRDWRSSFVSGLDAARRSGHGDDIAREGALLDPDSAIGGQIPDGTYRCRVIKLGAKSPGMLDYVSYPAFQCRVQPKGSLHAFAKLTGSQRQAGLIFPNDQLHQVFLGTLMLADEARAMKYGIDPKRDVVGYIERIGPSRWRLIMPDPAFESQMDVMELVPQG
jgi:hypothetical protein